MENKVIDKFLEYAKINSPSFKELDFAKKLKVDLEELGFQVFIDDSSELTGSNTGNIIAKLKGTKNTKTIMFSAHMDTVDPSIDIEPIIKDNTIYSKGNTILSADDKSGVAAIIEGIRHIVSNDIAHGDIEVVITTCEEVGLKGSTNLDYSKLESELSFVLDGGGKVGSVFVKGPAQTVLDVQFNGVSAHAGVSPEKGINAIQVAARAIDNMELLRIDDETTANIGFIQGGGATNIVTDKVVAKIECRSLDENKLDRHVDSIITAINNATNDFKTSADIEITKKYPAFSIDEDSDVVAVATKSLKDLGIDAKILPTGGGSDTNLYNANKIPSVILSTGMEKVHTTDEYIEIDDLVNSAKLVAKIIENI